MKKKLSIYFLSDTIVNAASELSKMVLNQYPDVHYSSNQASFLHTTKECREVLKSADPDSSIILFNFMNEILNSFVVDYCREHQLSYLDLVTPLEKEIFKKTGESPRFDRSVTQTLDESYFDRIDSIEFAVQYDDGQDPYGFLLADIVLLGVSRTSKTPLSMYLANQNYKVANLPLLPDTSLPPEIWEVDPQKLVGLTSDPEVLMAIRRERMVSYGLDEETPYSNMEKIKSELAFAESLFKQLGCLVINVASKSIQETASIITTTLMEKENDA